MTQSEDCSFHSVTRKAKDGSLLTS